MVIWHNQLLSTSGGAIFLVEVSLHTASACPVVGISLLLLLLLCSSVRCGGALFVGIVHEHSNSAVGLLSTNRTHLVSSETTTDD